jgi:DNA gyrase inhibitor GyrI
MRETYQICMFPALMRETTSLQTFRSIKSWAARSDISPGRSLTEEILR